MTDDGYVPPDYPTPVWYLERNPAAADPEGGPIAWYSVRNPAGPAASTDPPSQHPAARGRLLRRPTVYAVLGLLIALVCLGVLTT
ncbi:hypothetical protein [Streptomyces sp. NPDC093223]|uniref:hypothetical protein n=1 Tax=Streptomyces sp. NPDC093223 TaxID=3366033 RepID=UPI0037FC3715